MVNSMQLLTSGNPAPHPEPHGPGNESWYLVGVAGALGPGKNVERSEGRSQPHSLHSLWSAFLLGKSHPFFSLPNFKVLFLQILIVGFAERALGSLALQFPLLGLNR